MTRVKSAVTEAEPAIRPMPAKMAVSGPPGGSKNGPAANTAPPAKKTAMAAMKNLAIAGGLLCLFGYGHTRWSYDALRARRRDELAAHRTQQHATDAELRAARAEGRAEATGTPDVVDKRPFWRR